MRRWLHSLGTRQSDRRFRAIRDWFAFLRDDYEFIEDEATSTTLYERVTFKNSTTFVQVLIDRGDLVVFFGPLADGATRSLTISTSMTLPRCVATLCLPPRTT